MYFSELKSVQRRFDAMSPSELKKFTDANCPSFMQTDVVSLTVGNTIVTIDPTEAEYKVVDICYSSGR